MSYEGLQRIGQYRTALVHRKRGGWEFITMAKDALNNSKDKLNLEYNGNGFQRWYRTVSLELIGGLLILLVTILISVIGWNYICDDKAHSCAIEKINKLDKTKIGLEELHRESNLIRSDLVKMSDSHQHDIDRLTDKLDSSMSEIKRILMKKYANNGD